MMGATKGPASLAEAATCTSATGDGQILTEKLYSQANRQVDTTEKTGAVLIVGSSPFGKVSNRTAYLRTGLLTTMRYTVTLQSLRSVDHVHSTWKNLTGVLYHPAIVFRRAMALTDFPGNSICMV